MSLERALELAERGRGTAHPNPVVGAVVVADGEVVGEGWHERKGGPHAEVVALEAAGARARGATLYVTLEPCAHHGATPPCADAVIAAGVARVVVGAGIRTPRRTAGSGAAGGGDRGRATATRSRRGRQNEACRTWIAHGRPFVTYKAAVTLDGRVDACPGRRWVTGEESRRLVHELRAASDAVAVGMGTVREDDPRLDARDVDARAAAAPARVRSRARCPEGSELELRRGRSRRSCAARRPRASSRSCSRAGLRSPAFLAAASSTSCCSSSRPCSRAPGPGRCRCFPSRRRSRGCRCSRSGKTPYSGRHVHEP